MLLINKLLSTCDTNYELIFGIECVPHQAVLQLAGTSQALGQSKFGQHCHQPPARLSCTDLPLYHRVGKGQYRRKGNKPMKDGLLPTFHQAKNPGEIAAHGPHWDAVASITVGSHQTRYDPKTGMFFDDQINLRGGDRINLSNGMPDPRGTAHGGYNRR